MLHRNHIMNEYLLQIRPHALYRSLVDRSRRSSSLVTLHLRRKQKESPPLTPPPAVHSSTPYCRPSCESPSARLRSEGSDGRPSSERSESSEAIFPMSDETEEERGEGGHERSIDMIVSRRSRTGWNPSTMGGRMRGGGSTGALLPAQAPPLAMLHPLSPHAAPTETRPPLPGSAAPPAPPPPPPTLTCTTWAAAGAESGPEGGRRGGGTGGIARRVGRGGETSLGRLDDGTPHSSCRDSTRPASSGSSRLRSRGSHSAFPLARRMTSLHWSTAGSPAAIGTLRARQTGNVCSSVISLTPRCGCQAPVESEEPTSTSESPQQVLEQRHSKVAIQNPIVSAAPGCSILLCGRATAIPALESAW
jgi:hypothetical protein